MFPQEVSVRLRVISHSRANTVHTVTITHYPHKGWLHDRFNCTCEAIMFDQTTECRHIAQVRRAFLRSHFDYNEKELQHLVSTAT